jgi:16S rRNA (cytosine1402-N4)-methyltransferase
MKSQNSKYHSPVLFTESIEGLVLNPDGVYVDVTFGGGGHSKGILEKLSPKGRLFAFDQDADAHKNVIEDERFVLIPQNFRLLSNYLRFNGVKEFDGLLGDLGVSSHQFDEGTRGFSIRFDGPLDMRMDHNAKLSAKQVVNNYEEEELTRVLKEYGEVKQLFKVVNAITAARAEKPFETTQELVEVLQHLAPPKHTQKFLAQVFQAIRIEVNDEIGALQKLLTQCLKHTKVGGRVAIISYHSLEDRLVKNFFRGGHFDSEQEKDFYGNLIRPFKPVQNKAIAPSDEEIKRNPRSRSAKLRIAERLAE